MTYPIRTKPRSLRDWFASEPERFTRERSPKRSTFWAVVGLVGLVSTVLVLLNPDAVIDALGGTRRSGLAMVGAFVVPPVMVVLGVVFQFVWAHRFRVRDGGVVARGVLFIVPESLDVRDAFEAFATGGTSPERVYQAMRFLSANKVDPQVQTGQKIVALEASPADRLTFAGVLRMDRTKRGVMWIDQSPLTIAGDHFFDPPVMQAEASRSGAGAATSGA